MNDNEDQGYVPLLPPGQRKPVAAPQTQQPNAATDGGQGYVPLAPPGQRQSQAGGGDWPPPAQPSQGWGINLQRGPNWGDITVPQSVQDWGDIAGNEAMAYGIPSLRAQAEAARKRLGPVAAGSADFAGNVLSPTTLLSLLPGGAPIAGALHEGVKSYNEGNDWRTIADDAAGGAITGGVARGASAVVPKVAPLLVRAGVTGGVPAATTTLGHVIFGHGDIGREILSGGANIASTIGLLEMLNEAGKSAAAGTKNIVSSPATRQAIQNLILSGGSALRQSAGPYDNWMGAGP